MIRTEASMLSYYYDREFIDQTVRKGGHRHIIGGLWDEIGRLQTEFLIRNGLKPHHRLLDIGCGCLRAGVRLIRYLDAGNYFGTDLNESLLTVGYDVELAREGLQDKQPRSQLIADGDFDFSPFSVTFDFALAQSLFTHLPFQQLRECLTRLPSAVVPGGKLYATIFEVPTEHPRSEPYRHNPGGITTHETENPYHYRYADVEHCCRDLPWKPVYVGEWGHPRAQRMIEFVRT
jgi:SAM-dependent methyltransferase